MIAKGHMINERYEIISTIGEGGMANVYLAQDTILKRKVAVKVLRGDLAEDEKFVRRFQREAKSASGLSHPNIVEMYDVGEDNGKYFIVMEYVEGRTLKSLIKRRGGLTLPEVIDIMLQVTSAIACAHESYIIHRDIKPQNIIILDDGMVKITDFGISQALNSHELTETNSVMGSVHYIPPEQASGNRTTMQSDIYSLGILMFELIAGKVPFKGDNAVEIAIKQMKDPIPFITDIKENVPQSIENIILRSTAKNPKNRYETVLEMREDIETSLEKSRKEEPRIKFAYPEFENKNERNTPSRSKKHSEKEDPEDKKLNKAILIAGGILGFLVLSLCVILFVVPSIKKDKPIEVPDVRNMTVEQAEKELEDAGLEVEAKTLETYDDEIEEGKVIKTNPSANRTVKKGTSVTLTVSLGKNGFEAENYVGQNYVNIKASLEAKGIVVIIEEKEFTDKDTVKENAILTQSIEAGATLKEGDTITFTVPKIVKTYPDFTDGTYTISDIQKFCKDNDLKFKQKTLNTNDYPEGTIYSQDRAEGTKLISGVTLTITVTKKVDVTPPDNTTTPDNGSESDTGETS